MNSYKVIFWDFDGVIKDSVNVKSDAFEQLFLSFGNDVSKKVRKHHEENSGVSRFKKFPLYLEWAGEETTQEKVDEYCERFSNMVFQAVIDSAWVPGVREYLLSNCEKQYFVLVTATPQDEIIKILDAVKIRHCFREVYGAPKTKSSAISDVLSKLPCDSNDAIMIGDAEADLAAAEQNNVAFMLRKTPINLELQRRFNGPSFDNLNS